MIIRLGTYSHLRKTVKEYLDCNPNNEGPYNLNQLVQLTTAPVIVIAIFMKELQPSETWLDERIKTLYEFYGYTGIENG